MKSIGELKDTNLERCQFNDIFQNYDDIFPQLKVELKEYLSGYLKPRDKCVKCGNEISGLTANVLQDGRCGVCGYPGSKEHKVKCKGETFYFETLLLQVHPSELRG